MRRSVLALLAVLLFAVAAFGDTIIDTVAGGGPNNLPAVSASLNNPRAVATDAAGNLYIASPAQSRVFRVTSAGQLTVFAGNGDSGSSGDGGPATQATLGCPRGVALDAAGNLYIADECNSVVRKVSGGVISTVAGNGSMGSDGDGGPAIDASLGCPFGLAVDGAGSLYIADRCQERVRKVTAGIITTFAGNGTTGSGGDGGPAANAALSNPMGVAVDGAGNVYIADHDNYRIRKVTAGAISTFAGNGSSTPSGDGGAATAAGIGCAAAVAVDAGGSVFLVNNCDNLVRKVSGGNITAFAGDGILTFAGDGGPATAASLACPAGAAADAVGNVFIADMCNNRVRKVTLGIINTFAGNGTVAFSGDGGLAVNASLSSPTGAAVDAAGNLYIADQANAVIRKVSGGVITTVAGNGSFTFGGDGGPALNAGINPLAVVVDGAGNLYIADQSNNRVRKVTLAGVISTFAGNGTTVFGGDDGPATAAGISCPSGLALDTAGDLFIADRCHNRVREVTPDGTIHTVAGNGTSGSSGDGSPAINASLGCPFGLAVDSSGSLFIVDECQQNVRQVTPDGIIHTFAGTGVPGYTGDGGPATGATLSFPFGVAVDAAGDVFIADSSNNVIRKVAPGGAISTFAGNGNFSFSGDGGPATAATLACPFGVALDAAGNLFISDQCNNRIRRVSGSGSVVVIPVVLTSNPSPSTFGQMVTFTATVTPATATGTAEFFDGTTSLGTASLAAGSASLSTASLVAGAHSITAAYSGDVTFSGGASTPFGQVVNKATPVFSNLSSPAIPVGTASTTLSGTIGLGSLVPTGAVSITLNGATQSANIQNDGSFSASFGTGSLAVAGSPYAITYTYGGDANFTSASDSSKNLTVTPASTSITVTAPTVTYNAAGSVTVAVSSAGGVPTGSVALSVDGGAASSLPLSAGSATFSISSPSAGDHSLGAAYAAQGNFAASSATATLHVNKASTSTAVASSANPSAFGQSVTLTASVTSGSGSPSGSVQFFDGTTMLGTGGLSAGSATLALNNLAVGSHSITARYLGDANFDVSAAAALSQAVSKAATSTALASSVLSPTVGQPVTFTATVSTLCPPAVGVPTGTVQFSIDGSPAGGAVALAGGTAAMTTSSMTPGQHTIAATYTGDGNFNGSTSPGLSRTVSSAYTGTSLAASSNPSIFGGKVTFTATVSAGGAGPVTGTVQFSIDGSPFGAPVALAGGAASFSTSSLAAGSHTITGAYSGNANYPAGKGTLSQSVKPAPTASTVTVTPKTQQYSDLVSFTATLNPAIVNGLAPAQSVTFLVGTQTMGTAALAVVNGVLTAKLSNIPLLEPTPFGAAPTRQMAPDKHTVTAVFSGINPNFAVGNPQTSLTITPDDARVNYTGARSASTATSQSGNATVTLSVTVRDTSDVAGAAHDKTPGDIRNATVTFIDRNTNTPIATVPVGLVSAGDTETGTATYEWPVNIGKASSASFKVGVVVGGYYTRDNAGHSIAITVSRPSDEWVTGNGTLLLKNSAGAAAGGAGSSASFSFNAKFTSDGKKFQGSFQTTVHNGGRTYQIPSSSIGSLAAGNDAATFDGTATIEDITNPKSPVTLDGNAVFQINMTGKTLGITVWKQTGGLWFSSDWDGKKTVPLQPTSGSLTIH